MNEPLRVLVLAGGPDRERPVSLQSGRQVADALRQAGHAVLERDILPDDLSALDAFERWGGDVIFPVLHGWWGEGGQLQSLLDDLHLPYVGTAGPAAELCMNKHRTKLVLQARKIPTPDFELLNIGEPRTMDLPLVIKDPCEGSSLGLVICYKEEQVQAARNLIRQGSDKMLVEQYIRGRELTVGVIGERRGTYIADVALPPIQIIPATDFYDYDAKYIRNDTQYRFDIDLPDRVLEQVRQYALRTHQVLGCRHMSRVDFIVDEQHQPWVLEVNTIPGFTTHSLLPMAAARAGLNMPQLVDRLVRLAHATP